MVFGCFFILTVYNITIKCWIFHSSVENSFSVVTDGSSKAIEGKKTVASISSSLLRQARAPMHHIDQPQWASICRLLEMRRCAIVMHAVGDTKMELEYLVCWADSERSNDHGLGGGLRVGLSQGNCSSAALSENFFFFFTETWGIKAVKWWLLGCIIDLCRLWGFNKLLEKVSNMRVTSDIYMRISNHLNLPTHFAKIHQKTTWQVRILTAFLVNNQFNQIATDSEWSRVHMPYKTILQWHGMLSTENIFNNNAWNVVY